MKKSFLIAIIVILLLIGIYYFYKNESSDNNILNTQQQLSQNNTNYCSKRNFWANDSCVCPNGYLKTSSSGNAPPEMRISKYCKLDKKWEELQPCNEQSDCPENFTCYAEDPDKIDYRCAPDGAWQSDCSCFPGDGCACS